MKKLSAILIISFLFVSPVFAGNEDAKKTSTTTVPLKPPVIPPKPIFLPKLKLSSKSPAIPSKSKLHVPPQRALPLIPNFPRSISSQALSKLQSEAERDKPRGRAFTSAPRRNLPSSEVSTGRKLKRAFSSEALAKRTDVREGPSRRAKKKFQKTWKAISTQGMTSPRMKRRSRKGSVNRQKSPKVSPLVSFFDPKNNVKGKSKSSEENIELSAPKINESLTRKKIFLREEEDADCEKDIRHFDALRYIVERHLQNSEFDPEKYEYVLKGDIEQLCGMYLQRLQDSPEDDKASLVQNSKNFREVVGQEILWATGQEVTDAELIVFNTKLEDAKKRGLQNDVATHGICITPDVKRRRKHSATTSDVSRHLTSTLVTPKTRRRRLLEEAQKEEVQEEAPQREKISRETPLLQTMLRSRIDPEFLQSIKATEFEFEDAYVGHVKGKIDNWGKGKT